jgi:nucleotide-binding universal stress UspA family protein
VKVLVGIDGSEGGWDALRQAIALLPPQSSQVVLYYAPPKIRLSGTGATPELASQARDAVAKAAFDEALARMPPPLREQVTVIVGVQNPRRGLVLAAEQVHAGFVAVGAHGVSTTRLLLGSVTRSLLRHTTRPTLIARPGPVRESQSSYRVLWAIDEIPAVRTPIEFIEQLAWPAGAVGSVVHVVDPLAAMEVPAWFAERVGHDEEFSRGFRAEYDADKQKKFNEMATFAADLPQPFGALPILLEGNAAEAIIAKAREESADLIIVGTRDLGAAERFLIGSTAENILQFASCSVLVVHTPIKP